jgi:hypothetical protein
MDADRVDSLGRLTRFCSNIAFIIDKDCRQCKLVSEMIPYNVSFGVKRIAIMSNYSAGSRLL